ncbi:MAG: CDP-diacylglycerol--serine O-phosphatidyltransferase [Gemmatimonadales bacterium]|nr:CDP-diacylglycerol--serine O-phosphatidyltransferase [Gemmatimonadales bacterium]NIN11652.1 CDP-diacylglycerol--serine O-phosphatidyltransferase [Gemmatimonadales bacterium]NIN50258.1 CDP-diacylglycerol--serine O-phosphatidyltransferase [Gemmatimonadales bacterium]NIP07722.1 CDP-diacylglycerol--serine O-phosphatidyltransferase [Gemmatimonadales bacterium]NIQ99125.1 CDP-diacylglycerol--serine O-phosphatidyltransferase [Gemmatimonadales bacterium]
MRRKTRHRRRMRRAIIVVPSIFTLANLFFGIWSIVLASQREFYLASWWIVIAGVLDMMDGLLARVSKTGSRFGAELDSLVDIVSFGIAPAVLLYFLHFSAQGQFAWIFLYGFMVCVALRLARYNVQAGDAPHASFTGMPSPAAGMTLATYYPFTRTEFYQSQLASLPWNQILIFLIIALSLAMVSNIQYARLPRIGIRTWHGRLGLAVNLTIIGFAIWGRDIFFFPLGIAYTSYGIVRAAVTGFLERGEEEPREGARARRTIPFIVRDSEAPKRRRWREPPAQER